MVVKFFEFDRLVFVFGLEVAEKFDVMLNKTGFDWFEYSDPMMMVAVELLEMVELMEIVDKQFDLIVVVVDIWSIDDHLLDNYYQIIYFQARYWQI